ncbi:RNA 2'-phosphotransferase [Taklimakanibacter albus]|uniref:RNA 2'-phosphotransferase n=1 Tax=Taklimakanibacter albus TaxID=2800327 RepID=A0ACC5RF51_9HYPH|nr:RNA 2'-phosphotransferase [Aestuariivirga sp. YIM B02566]MBK1871288.1 RNA 2'-phosphotransferase [Aestuariivirga sp. YIM B02566]
MEKNITRLSKFLSYVLRHAPEEIGLVLGEGGWVATDDLIAKARANGQDLTPDILREIVATNDKKRFTLSPNGMRIRAAQGHSVAVDLELAPAAPPAVLYHGTAAAVLDKILAEGLKPQARRHVHLSADRETARKVGMRHGKPVVLLVAASRMRDDGLFFYQADNGVWLTEAVAPHYLTVKD